VQLKVRDERLGEASELQKFLQNLDHFQQWLTRTETAIASEDIPNDLVEAEQLLHDHALLKQEIDTYAPDYAQMKDYGQKVVEGQEGVQYMFLREVCLSRHLLTPVLAVDMNGSLFAVYCRLKCLTETGGTVDSTVANS